MTQPLVRVYSRPGCHLCEQLIQELMPLIRGRARIEVLDVDSRHEWQRQFGTRIPVVQIGGQVVCEYRLDPDAVERTLAAGTEGRDPHRS